VWLSKPARGPLGQLLLSFVALALALVLTIGGLLHSALVRLEEQRELRHRVVAERVFDEVEREIGSVLQHEATRPSESYDAIDTDPSRWSRFVVGYYRREPGLTVLAESALDASRRSRLRDVLQLTAADMEQARQRSAAERGVAQPLRAGPLYASAAPRASLDDVRTPASSPDVLRQLNRGLQVRERRMHEFATSFALVRSGNLVVAERQAPDGSRSEGLVIDVAVLLETTQGWVLGSQDLRQLAALTLLPESTSGRAQTAGYHFVHRLAAPFDAYRVSLRLARLDDEDASSALYGFVGLFVLAAALGLLAIYRMVVVQVGFAERSNNFVSAVTHELRTPLTSIRMYGEMLRDGMVSDEQVKHEYYATITAEGERLTRLINNVMEHGRLRRGQRYAHLERGDAAALVREVVELMRPHIEREGFCVQVRAAPDLPQVQIDKDALKQVLFNVLDNALKYGRSETACTIDVACEASANVGVSIRVRDHGRGVSEHQLGSVFEPFFRGESELTRRHQGTGLGLALVRDLIELMGGSVRGRSVAPGFEVQITLRGA
jgi:signal transduction histidine kinase